MCSGLRAPRKRHLKHLLVRLLCCCPKSKSSSVSKESSDEGEEEGTVMGPMTLSEYVSTLEPYDPWLHGWRGQEPRRVWLPPTPQSSSQPPKHPASRKRRHAHK